MWLHRYRRATPSDRNISLYLACLKTCCQDCTIGYRENEDLFHVIGTNVDLETRRDIIDRMMERDSEISSGRL